MTITRYDDIIEISVYNILTADDEYCITNEYRVEMAVI